MATQKQFEDLLRDIEPSSTTKSNCSDAHSTLRKFLFDDEEFKKVHRNTYLAGSYKRDTAIRPQIVDGKSRRPDVDIIVLTNHQFTDKPKDVVCLVYKTLKKKYTSVEQNQRSICVQTDKVDMDVVPIIAPYGEGSTLYIADRKLDQWIETNPPDHTKWTTQINEDTGGRFKPLVKLLKWWRRQNPTVTRKPKGFVIETIVAECMDRNQANWAELFVGTLEKIVSKYRTAVETGQVPVIVDPSVSKNSVTAGMTADAFKGFYNKAKAHAELGRKAIQEKDPEKELGFWREILGDRFPAALRQAVQASATASLLAPAASAAAPLAFPDRPVRPNKPAGFA
jgi:hypothetical protein